MIPRLKVCGVTTPEDARRAVAMGADYVGVILYPKSPRYVAPENVPEILSAIPGGQRVVVDVDPAADRLENLGDLGFDYFQIHFDLDTSLSSLAAWSGIVGADRLWLAPRIAPADAFPQVILEFAETILIDAYSRNAFGGTGETAAWDRFVDWKTLYQHKRFVLAGGLNPENIASAIQGVEPAVVDVNSGVESAPGKKDFEKLQRLIDNLKAAAAECYLE